MATPASKSSQEFIPIKEIRDGILVLKDGSMRAIIMTSSLNFALKSMDEQNSIIYQFQNFLNSLNFSIQIFVESRKLDVRPYIALLEQREKDQTIDLMKVQTHEYIEFIKDFTENTNIMTKSFFVVIPFAPAMIQTKKGFAQGLGLFKKKQSKAENLEDSIQDFETYRSQLEQRVGVVEQGLVRCGIRVVQLGTEELIELFYKIFNPGDTEKPIHLS